MIIPIPISLHGPPISSATEYLARQSRTSVGSEAESDLLKSIRIALRGTGTDLASSIHTAYSISNDDPSAIDELTWDAHTVIIGAGGVMRKKWNFEEEGQPVQWACTGLLEQASVPTSASSQSATGGSSSEQDDDDGVGDSASVQRPTFGPFAQAQQRRRPPAEPATLVSAVFVFLRSIGKIFLANGLDYTFSLPFIVRKAWPLYPHGVVIQRVLEPSELVEAELTGDAVLPTIFAVTSPFSEAGAVGLTTGILGGGGRVPVSLKDEDENSTKPLKSISPTEMVVWASHRGPEAQDNVLVTVDSETNLLSIWRYAYIKPKDIPVPLGRLRTRNTTRKRQSMTMPGSRRSSALYNTHPLSPTTQPNELPPTLEVPELPPLSALPGMAPSLSTTTTMASLVSGGLSQVSGPSKGRRNSLTRNDLSVTMDRMVLGGRMDVDTALAPIEHGRMKAAYWMERVYSQEVPDYVTKSWRDTSVALFDQRWDGAVDRSLMAICIPATQTLEIFSLTYNEDHALGITRLTPRSAISVASIRATRGNVWDLLIVKPDGRLSLLTHGLYELPLRLVRENKPPIGSAMDVDADSGRHQIHIDHGRIVSVGDVILSAVTLVFEDGWRSRTTIDLVPQDRLTIQAMQILSLTLPADMSFLLHRNFLEIWASRGRRTSNGIEFDCLALALYKSFGLEEVPRPLFVPRPEPVWQSLAGSPSRKRFRDDPVFRRLQTPLPVRTTTLIHGSSKPHTLLAPILYSLHALGEDLRLSVRRYACVLRLAPVICRIARVIRPEWADYWKRLCPDAISDWPSLAANRTEYFDDRIPVWPPDISAVLYGRISNPEWKVPWFDAHLMAIRLDITPSYIYGRPESLSYLQRLTPVYKCLADNKVAGTHKRAENAVQLLVTSKGGTEFIQTLPLGIAAPLIEALRTCQVAPPGDWPLSAYRAIGRDDLAACASDAPDMPYNDGYRAVKDFINPSRPRRTIQELASEARASGAGEVDPVSGVQLDLKDFTDIRFGQDRRLDEVARMLCSSVIPTVKIMERPELSEHDQAKEQQHQVICIAERTLALPYGRAMFTFGSIPTVTREAYSIPKIEYAVRVLPQNITLSPEPGKIPQDCLNWGEFHNGVAAGLRISPSAGGVESSWIAFNKPSELTPEHAGFLYGLGLTGHLKEMLTWHTFAYLTPKHDLTSIGVLLGLSAANVGTANRHVTKLLAVHTPALLPTPGIDLNVSLMTQAAGLAGVGLLYMGTKNRRMAEVCLNQISRKDLVQPDLSNEHREAYTNAAALAFGMIMLGKGSSVPADMSLLSRLSVLVHGDAHSLYGNKSKPAFDINLTSPAATVALGMMYLRTERQDVADVLAIPDTVVGLNRVQPYFLLMRTIARSLIMWDSIAPTSAWLNAQVPPPIAKAMEPRFQQPSKVVDDAFELAWYNLIAGCCFMIGLKYAGTAREEAYQIIFSYFNIFTRLGYSSGPAFDHKIRRAAVRDGLNLISISLSMVMAGTGETSCLRSLRYAYGMYHQAYRYGIHVATHLSLGLLFLGGGGFTLGTSDAAIACMIVAFFPRTHQLSSDNKSYLQALRHMWVLAVEPRCLVARDVDTKEVVHLPVKITIKEGRGTGTTQLISPTLIPDLDKLVSIRVNTPRYWPFYLDIENLPRHKESLLRSQILYVKRRTAFLSYTEDPRGSRSLFVRSGSSAGDAATLDFPQSTDTKAHPASDLSEFITSFSNDVLFLAFADHFSREDGETADERSFYRYCHASLLDSILQDKPQTLQTHLTLYRYRTMSPDSPYFHLRLQDLRFAADFYSKIYDRRFSGRSENNVRAPLVRDTTVSGALHALDKQLDEIRVSPLFTAALGQYARGEEVTASNSVSKYLSWYLLRNGVPVSTLLLILKGLARDAHAQCLGVPPPGGTSDSAALDQGIKEVLHGTGSKMTTALGSGWSVRSLDEIIEAWKVIL